MGKIRAIQPGMLAVRATAGVFLLWCCLCCAPSAGAAAATLNRETAFAVETLALVNAERQAKGYSLLAKDEKLDAVARDILKEAVGSVSLKKLSDNMVRGFLKNRGVPFAVYRQGYARGNSLSPAAAVAAYKKNGYSCTNKDGFVRAGVAVGTDDRGKRYYAIVVVTPPESITFSGGHAARKKRIMNAVNAARRKKGLSALRYEPGLDAAATIRAGDLTKKYSKDRPDGSSALSLFTVHAASLASYSQSYGKSALSPDAFAAGWEKKTAASGALEEKYTSAGIGIAVSKGTLYWCMVSVEPKVFRTQAELDLFRKKVLLLTNAERARHGLGELRSDAGLDKVGDARAGELVRLYDAGHRRPDRRTWSTILAEYKIPWQNCGENIANGQKTPADVVTAWMNSPGHRANILNKDFTHLGVGVHMGAGGHLYWAQNFLRFK